MTMEWSRPPQLQEPPSTYAVAAWVDGERGSFLRVLNLTASRALFLAPGLYLSGVRDPKMLLKASLGASVSVSGMLALIYWLRRKEKGRAAGS